jgi:hypothetical protein
MILKTKAKYYKLFDHKYKIKCSGYQIQVKNYRFFVDKDFQITEKTTGMKIPQTRDLIRKKDKTLEDIEKYLELKYNVIDFVINNMNEDYLKDAVEVSESDYYNIYAHQK